MASSSQSTTEPSVSIRKYIRWLPDGQFNEPTSTIVLTSQSNYFVDIRILKSIGVPSALEIPSLIKSLPLSRLDWAFAGVATSTVHSRHQSASAASNGSGKKEKLKELSSNTEVDSKKEKLKEQSSSSEASGKKEKLKELSSSTEASGSTGPAPDTAPHHKRNKSGPSSYRQTTWSHWVDSRHVKGSKPGSTTPSTSDLPATSDQASGEWVDCGTTYPTDKDDESLEKGRMINPETGLEMDYEERWRDLPIQELTHEPGLLSFVLKAENTALGTRGLVIRVGGWCQGIIRSGNDLGVERWKFGGIGALGTAGLVDEPGMNDAIATKSWERIAKFGEMSLPCKVCWEKAWELQVGEEVVSGGLKWEVVEKHVWKKG